MYASWMMQDVCKLHDASWMMQDVCKLHDARRIMQNMEGGDYILCATSLNAPP